MVGRVAMKVLMLKTSHLYPEHLKQANVIGEKEEEKNIVVVYWTYHLINCEHSDPWSDRGGGEGAGGRVQGAGGKGKK